MKELLNLKEQIDVADKAILTITALLLQTEFHHTPPHEIGSMLRALIHALRSLDYVDEEMRKEASSRGFCIDRPASSVEASERLNTARENLRKAIYNFEAAADGRALVLFDMHDIRYAAVEFLYPEEESPDC